MSNRLTALAVLAALALSLSAPAQRILHQFPAGFGTFETGGAGDVDADGHDDIFFGTSNIVSLYSGDDGSHIRSYTMAPTDHAGAVDDVGDVDLDGASDLGIVFDCYDPSTGQSATLVRVYSGLTGAILHQFAGLSGTVFFLGTHIRGIGDVDADGVSDICMMLKMGTEPGFQSTVQVRSGATGAMLWSTLTPFAAEYSDCGDVDGDGHDEFMVATSGYPAGNLQVISGATGQVLRTHAISGQRLALAGGMDVDGDGFSDYVFGPGSTFAPGVGATVVSGATGSTIHIHPGGNSVSMGDYNGDGRGDVLAEDFIIQGGTAAEVYSGLSGDLLLDLGAAVNTPLEPRFVGDVDGDGLEDLLCRATVPGGYGIFVIAGERAMGPNGDSMLHDAAGNDHDVLKINGTAGGAQRCVGVNAGDPILFQLDKPSYDPAPMCHVVVFGGLGVPMEDEAHALSGVQGDLAFLPRPSAPNHALLFTLFSSFGNLPGGVLMHTPPAPFTVPVPQGIWFPIEMTFQGVMIESDLDVKRTNGIILRVH